MALRSRFTQSLMFALSCLRERANTKALALGEITKAVLHNQIEQLHLRGITKGETTELITHVLHLEYR